MVCRLLPALEYTREIGMLLLFTVFMECCTNSDAGDSSTIPSTAAQGNNLCLNGFLHHLHQIFCTDSTIPEIHYMFTDVWSLSYHSHAFFQQPPFGSSILLFDHVISAGTQWCPCHNLWPHDCLSLLFTINRAWDGGVNGRKWCMHLVLVGPKLTRHIYKTKPSWGWWGVQATAFSFPVPFPLSWELGFPDSAACFLLWLLFSSPEFIWCATPNWQ